MRNHRLLATCAALTMALGIVGHATTASAYDMSCLPPIDDCQFKWYAQSQIQGPAGEGSEMQGSGGTMSFVWRKVVLSFDGDRQLVPLDADAWFPCENRGGESNNYSQGGGQ